MPVRGTWAEAMRWLLMAPSGPWAARLSQIVAAQDGQIEKPEAAPEQTLCTTATASARLAALGANFLEAHDLFNIVT